MIPKIIHYCWLSGDPIPKNLQKCMDSWQQKLIGYEFILWDFNRFDINSSLWVKQAFEAKKYAFAADVIRLFAVYHYGGIYLDMDIEVIKPFDDLLQNNIMIAYEDNRTKTVEAGCFGADPEHPFIKECLNYFNNKNFTLKVIDDGYTLPRIMRNIYLDNPASYHLKFYTSDYFTAKKFRTGVIKTTSNTYAIHHFAGSWFSEQEYTNQRTSEKIVSFFGDNFFSVFIILCMAIINRIKKYGIVKTLYYYISKIYS